MKNKTIILNYHSIEKPATGEIGASLYCVSTENFKKQMEYLAQIARRKNKDEIASSAQQVNDSLLGMTNPKDTINKSCLVMTEKNNIIVTFDDGDITNYEIAYPILKKGGITAYFFILAGKVGSPNYMSWEQIKELGNAGMIIGSHGMMHTILTRMKNEDIEFELRQSKEILEKNLGKKIDFLSIPKGEYNARVIKKARETGYKAVFTSNPFDNDNFRKGRISVRANWDMNHFIKAVTKGPSFKNKIREIAKTFVKNTLGIVFYNKIRKDILKNRGSND